MTVCADPPLSPLGCQADLFGGLANWAIFLDHIQQEVLSCITRTG